MQWYQIHWPVFRLGDIQPVTKNGVIYTTTEYYDLSSNELIKRKSIIDDKSLPGDTLGKRRLHIKEDKAKINMAIYFLGDLIKLAKPTIWFIKITF